MGYFTNFVELDVLPETWEEMANPEPSPTETISSDSFQGTRVFKVPWAQRVSFVNAVLGYAKGKTLYLPHRYPACPAAIAVEANVKPMGTYSFSKSMLSWEAALITVTYKTQEYETRTGQVREPFVIESLEGAAEFVTVPAAGLYWDKDLTEPLDDNEAPGLLRKMKTWVYTMKRLPVVPPEIDGWIGKVNARALMSKQFGETFPSETLLFGVPTIVSSTTIAGNLSYDVSINMTYNPIGWNKFMRKGGQLAQRIYAQVQKQISPTRVETVTEPYNVYSPVAVNTIVPQGVNV